MTEQHLLDLLQQTLDHTLPAEKDARLTAYLAAHPESRVLQQRLQDVDAQLRAAPPLPLPTDFQAQLQARLVNLPPPHRQAKRANLVWGGLIGLVVWLAVCVVSVLWAAQHINTVVATGIDALLWGATRWQTMMHLWQSFTSTLTAFFGSFGGYYALGFVVLWLAAIVLWVVVFRHYQRLEKVS